MSASPSAPAESGPLAYARQLLVRMGILSSDEADSTPTARGEEPFSRVDAAGAPDFSKYDGAQFMLPAAATWLPITFVQTVCVFIVILLISVTALDAVGEWASDTSRVVQLTGCPEPQDRFSPSRCSGIDFPSGAIASVDFEDMEPLMRWLRLSLKVHVGPEVVRPNNESLIFSVTVLAREEEDGEWETLIRSTTTKELLCPSRALLRVEPCDVFNVVFHDGLAYEHYRVTVAVARASRAEASLWLRDVELHAEHGRAGLGALDLGMRLAGAVVTLMALAAFTREMWPFPWSLWLPQQYAVAGYLCCLILYNNPAVPSIALLGQPNLFYPTVFQNVFVAAGAVLALVLLDTRHAESAEETARREMDGGGMPAGRYASRAPAPLVPGAIRAGADWVPVDDPPGGVSRESSVAQGPALEGTEGADALIEGDEDLLDALEDDSLSAFGGSSVPASAFWIPKLVLGVLVFLTALILDTTLYIHQKTDPGATYSSLPGWQGLYAFEGIVAIIWVAYACRLALVGLKLAGDEYVRLKRDAEQGRLRLDRSHVAMSKGYLATATAFVLAILGIHLREGVRTRVSDHPTYSDTAFRTAVQNLVVANVMGLGLAFCFRPSKMTAEIRRSGGLRAALEQGTAGFGGLSRALRAYSDELGRRRQRSKEGLARSKGSKAARPDGGASLGEEAELAAAAPTAREGSDIGLAPAPAATSSPSASSTAYGASQPASVAGAPPGKSAEELRREVLSAKSTNDGHMLIRGFLKDYSNKMRAAWAKTGDGPVPPEDLAELRELQAALEKLPATARHVNHIKWKYPVFFTSTQEYAWAVVVKDVDSAEGRAHWCAKTPGLEARLGPADAPALLPQAGLPPAPSVRALLAHLAALGLAFETRPAESLGKHHTLILIKATGEAVRREHLRGYRERLRVELELAWKPPSPMTTADRLSAVARLLTDHPVPGQSHVGLERGQLTFKAGDLDIVEASFPLHDRAVNARLHAELRRVYVLNDEQLTALRNHYGEEMAFYYAFLNFSCTWLAPMAGLGVLFFLLQYSDADGVYELGYVLFASLSVIWGALVYVFWRRRSHELAVLWDVSSVQEVEDVNPAFRGAVVADKVHGGARPHVPYWSRLPAFSHTAFHMVIQVLVLIVLEYCVYAHWVWLNETYDNPESSIVVYYLHSFVLNSLLYIFLIMYGQYVVWGIVAWWCTGKENWPSMRLFHRNYVAYVFVFIWLDGYMWSLIIGFVHIPLVETYEGDLTEVVFPIWGRLFRTNDHDADYWMAKHDSTIIAMLSTNQIAGLLAENVAPIVVVWYLHRNLRAHRAKLAKRREQQQGSPGGGTGGGGDPTDPLRALSMQAVDEWWLLGYSTQDDYYDTTLFIGYIATYTVIWPVTPLMCWVNNHVELRTDLIKINKAWRRNVPRRVTGIGSWQPALGISIGLSTFLVVAFATISTRHAEVFFRLSQNPAHPDHDYYWNRDTGHVWLSYRFVVLFIWEHLLAAILFLIYFFMPPLSERVRDVRHLKAKRRVDAERREKEEELRRELQGAENQARGFRSTPSGQRILATVSPWGTATLESAETLRRIAKQKEYTEGTQRTLEETIGKPPPLGPVSRAMAWAWDPGAETADATARRNHNHKE